MTSLARRVMRDEQMDDPALDAAVHRQVLGDLARVNRWTMAARPTVAFLDRTTARREHLRLLDVGFGHGDMLRRIASWARSRRITAELVGVDLNPNSVSVAREETPQNSGIEYLAGDYAEVPGLFDFVVSNLVAHHMAEGELIRFVRFMEAKARRGWLVNDLHRHRLAHAAYPVLARLMRTHRIVREDGTLSIARSFRPAEWRSVICEAGVPQDRARIARRFPFRLCVERLF